MLRAAVCDLVPALVADMTRWMDAEAEPPAPLNRHDQPPNKRHVAHPHYDSSAFQALNLSPSILRVVAGLLLGAPRLMAAVATRMDADADAQPAPGFHRDDDGFRVPVGMRNPHNDYQTGGGEIYCGHVATWVALADVPAGTGFCVVRRLTTTQFLIVSTSFAHETMNAWSY
eukprot:SAG31_NODE_601_length_13643_cov_64.237005_11_plen_172_part_00